MWESSERKGLQVKPFRGPGGLEMFRLTAGSAVAEVAPGRGALITRFAVGGDEILYLDPATLIDKKQNVRGGIPVLFPIAGRLAGDRYSVPLPGQAPEAAPPGRKVEPQSFPMRQHGLARHAAWEVVRLQHARLTMELCSSPASRVNFPFEFAVRLTVDVGRAGYRSLGIEIEVENRDKKPLPLHLGFHPYFAVPEASKNEVHVEVPAGVAFDNLSGQLGPYKPEAVNFMATEVDLHLRELRGQRAVLRVPNKAPRLIAFSDLFSTVVLWTTTLKDFVCVEPWSAPGNALNTGEGLIFVEPGKTRRGEVEISV